jgi:hypothetical protein
LMQEIHAADRIYKAEEGFDILCNDFFVEV